MIKVEVAEWLPVLVWMVASFGLGFWVRGSLWLLDMEETDRFDMSDPEETTTEEEDAWMEEVLRRAGIEWKRDGGE